MKFFGGGNILRLTELYYSQNRFDDRLELKGDRLPVDSGFFFGLSGFIDLIFCGGQPGNIQARTWDKIGKSLRRGGQKNGVCEDRTRVRLGDCFVNSIDGRNACG